MKLRSIAAPLFGLAGAALVAAASRSPLVTKAATTVGRAVRRPSSASDGVPTPAYPGDLESLPALRSPLDGDTGLPDATYFDLAARSRVVAAARHLWPVTVVLLELRFEHTPDEAASTEAARSFTSLVRQTLRESDIACRLGPTTFGLVLEDTSEEGGVWTIERLQIALARDPARGERISAGVATYPTHGLRPDEVMTRARVAFGRARAGAGPGGLGPVEVAPVER